MLDRGDYRYKDSIRRGVPRATMGTPATNGGRVESASGPEDGKRDGRRPKRRRRRRRRRKQTNSRPNSRFSFIMSLIPLPLLSYHASGPQALP